MNEQEADLAKRIYAAMQSFSVNSERGLQAQAFRVGVSDLGYCSERTRRMLDQQVPEDTDMLKAFIGTALGDHVEQAILAAKDVFPDAIRQADVVLRLTDGQRTFEVPGHPDLILPGEGIVLDAKSSDGLSLARRLGADRQKNFQRHGYGLGAWEAGYFGDRPLEEVLVGNVWIDRSGDEQEVHVELVPFDPDVIAEAGRWLSEVIYAYINGTEAAKEPAREVCAATCGFFRVCRAFDTDVSGLLTDPEVLEAIKMYREGLEMEKAGKRLKDHAKPALKDMAGSTGEFTLRWVHVNEVEVPATKRRAYDKIDIRPIK
jgi:hypothetical protein